MRLIPGGNNNLMIYIRGIICKSRSCCISVKNEGQSIYEAHHSSKTKFDPDQINCRFNTKVHLTDYCY